MKNKHRCRYPLRIPISGNEILCRKGPAYGLKLEYTCLSYYCVEHITHLYKFFSKNGDKYTKFSKIQIDHTIEAIIKVYEE